MARALIVDDEPLLLILCAQVLEARGFTVTCEGSGEAALSRLEVERFDLLLLDVNLPGRSGLEVLAAAGARLQGVSVLVMSSDPGYRDAALTAGAVEFLCKPTLLPALEAALERVT